MIVRSLLTSKNPFNSTEEIKQWIEQRNREVEVKVNRIPFAEMKMWHSEDDGSIRLDSGHFQNLETLAFINFSQSRERDLCANATVKLLLKLARTCLYW